MKAIYCPDLDKSKSFILNNVSLEEIKKTFEKNFPDYVFRSSYIGCIYVLNYDDEKVSAKEYKEKSFSFWEKNMMYSILDVME